MKNRIPNRKVLDMSSEEIIIQTDNVKVRVIELQAGEQGPFHFHTEVTDNMFGISGEITVSKKNPVETVILKPGMRCSLEPGRVHRVSNGHCSAHSEYLLIQGIGTYDFIREKT